MSPGPHQLRVDIDPQRCMGSGNCAYWAAEVFDVGDEMVAVVVGDPDQHRDRVDLAVEHCPTKAITLHVVTDRDGGTVGP